MAETIRRVAVGEISSVRVTCQDCKTTVEVAPRELTRILNESRCRHCGTLLTGQDDTYAARTLGHFADAIAGAEKLEKSVLIEFPVRLE